MQEDPCSTCRNTSTGTSDPLFATGALSVSAALHRRPEELPERLALQDLLLGGVAVHTLSRLLTKGEVISPLRAAFTEFEAGSGSAEHDERPRGDEGLRHTGLLTAPRPTRACASVLVVTAASDFFITPRAAA